MESDMNGDASAIITSDWDPDLEVAELGLDAKQSNLSEGRNARIESGY